ncbi:MAG: translocation/assembly module TamB domain-containing protein [Gammaproteobacteria bacterium]
MTLRYIGRQFAKALLILVLLTLILFTFGIVSTTGSAFVVSKLSTALGPGVTIRKFEGRLVDRFSIESLTLNVDKTRISITNLDVGWTAKALLNRKLLIQHLKAERVFIQAEPSKQDTASSEQAEIPNLPVEVSIVALSVPVVEISIGESVHQLNDIKLGLRWSDLGINVETLMLGIAEHHFSLNAMLRDEAPIIAEGGLAWSGALDNIASGAELTFNGPIDAFNFGITSEGFINATANGLIDLTDPLIPLSATIKHGEKQLSTDSGMRVLSGALSVSGDLRTLEFSSKILGSSKPAEIFELTVAGQANGLADLPASTSATFDWQIKHPAISDAPLEGISNLVYNAELLTVQVETRAPYQARLDALLTPMNLEQQNTVKVTWSELSVPTADRGELVAEKGQINFIGTPTAAKIDLESNWRHSQLGPASMSISGALAGKQFDITKGSAKLLKGELEYIGNVGWQDFPTANIQVDAKRLDISVIRPDIETQLDLLGTVRIRAPETGASAEVDVKHLNGQWGGQKLQASATLVAGRDQINIEKLDVKIGPNRVSASLSMQEKLRGTYTIEAPNLSHLLPSIGGRVSGSGKLRGTRQQPVVVGDLNAEQLRFAGWSVESIKLDYDVNPLAARQSSINGTLVGLSEKTGKGLTANGSLRVEGNPQAHFAGIQFDSNYANFSSQLRGRWQESGWDAEINSLALNETAAGNWLLAKPVRFSVKQVGTFSLNDPLCLDQDESRLCINAAQHGNGKTVANGQLVSIPIAAVNPWLPNSIKARGSLSSDFDVNIVGKQIRGGGKFGVIDGYLSTTINSDTSREIRIDEFSGRFDALPTSLKINLNGRIGDWLDIKIGGDLPPAADGLLAINLIGTSNNIEWLGEFIPELAGSSGRFDFAGDITGTRDEPLVNLKAELKSGKLAVPEGGLLFSAVAFNLSNDGPNKFKIDISAKPQQGEFKLSGNVQRTAQNSWPFDLELSGEAFSAARLPDLEMDITPSLRIAGTTDRVAVSGLVLIPHFAYTVNEIPKSAVRISDDTVIVNGEGENREELQPPPNWLHESLALDVDVELGDDVTTTGLGLFASLAGRINVSKAFGDEINGNGNVLIAQGNFDAYGHALSISDGRLMFAGPITNPTLNIRAIRDNIPVVAGVAITGTARAPKFDIFSDPVMPDTEALSYVITGRPLGEGSNADAALISKAAIGFGLEQSSIITNQLRDLFSLDEFGLNVDGNVDQTALVAGKQLTPKVSVRTEMNIFDQLWSFFLRYKLTDQWSIEAESGDHQGADIIYNVEHEKLEDFNPLR